MLLTEYNLCYYLLGKGMLQLEDLIEGKFSARRSDSRNNNFLVNKEYENNSYFIKQVKASETEKIETLHTEAACYQLAQQDPHYKILKQFLPQFYHYDPLDHVLIIEQIKQSFSLHDFYFQLGEFANEIPELIADTLASYHSTINNQTSSLQHFRRTKPWVFTLATAPPSWPSGPRPTVEQQIVQLIFKNPEFVQLLRQVDSEWHPVTLVHNDIKFTNFLLDYDYENKKINEVKLIDWELADVGDPLWDAAAVMQNYLLLWLSTDLPEQLRQEVPVKKISLQEVQPCIHSFWKRYIQQLKIDNNRQRTLLVKTTKYVALKLIHSCFEMAPGSSVLQPTSVKMLQMCLNILKSPEDAAVRLLGIK